MHPFHLNSETVFEEYEKYLYHNFIIQIYSGNIRTTKSLRKSCDKTNLGNKIICE